MLIKCEEFFTSYERLAINLYEPFKDEAQTALFKDPVRTAQ
jgi:hypothetical protein